MTPPTARSLPWAVFRLGSVADIRLGKMLSPKAHEPGLTQLPYLRNENVRWGHIDTTDVKTMGFRNHEIDRYSILPGDLLVCEGGEPGRCAVYTGPPNAFLYQKALHRVRCDTHRLDPFYLQYFFRRFSSAGAIRNRVSQTTIAHLPLEEMRELEVPLPPIEEQRALVEALEARFSQLDAGLSLLQSCRQRLSQYRVSVLKAAVEGRLVPTEAELARSEGRFPQYVAPLTAPTDMVRKKRAGRLWGGGEVPALTEEERRLLPCGWIWVKVRDLGESPEDAVQVGPMSMRSQDFDVGGVPVFNVGCVLWDDFNENKLNYLPAHIAAAFDRYRVRPGDVLFTRSGTIGRCAVVRSHQNGWLMTFHLLRVRVSPQRCLPAFLRIVFEGAAHIRRQRRFAAIGTTRAGFNTNLLAALDVPLPTVGEQKRIVTEVERRLSVCNALRVTVLDQLARSQALRSAILKATFDGRLTISDAAVVG